MSVRVLGANTKSRYLYPRYVSADMRVFHLISPSATGQFRYVERTLATDKAHAILYPDGEEQVAAQVPHDHSFRPNTNQQEPLVLVWMQSRSWRDK